jgi:Arc/MetJ-type ribon-helix-helix transcriptional regulator
MVVGMATKKVTITLDEEQRERVRSLVDGGRAASISGFVAHAVSVALDDVAGWGAMLAAALSETGGDLTPDERVWADRILGVKKKGKRPAA